MDFVWLYSQIVLSFYKNAKMQKEVTLKNA